MSSWLVSDLEQIVRKAHREDRRERSAERYAATLAQVRRFLAEHPDASANAVHHEIGGRRRDVLRAVRAVRTRFPSRGNHHHATGEER